uniref:Uncharacterized protein n=1 Tax=Rhizophora mucronata TaxID=61149 RepID=A0A2P2NTP6_RHIMU
MLQTKKILHTNTKYPTVPPMTKKSL